MAKVKVRVGDLVMADRRQISSLTAECLPEVVWLRAGQVMEITRAGRVRVRYGETFFAWFDLDSIYPAQGFSLFGNEQDASPH